MNAQAQLSAAQHLASSAAATTNPATLESSGATAEGEEDIPELEEAADDDAPVDESGVDAKDIELVMNQVGCSRAKAVRVLKESGGDLINASGYIFFPNNWIFITENQLWQRANDRPFVCRHCIISRLCLCNRRLAVAISLLPYYLLRRATLGVDELLRCPLWDCELRRRSSSSSEI